MNWYRRSGKLSGKRTGGQTNEVNLPLFYSFCQVLMFDYLPVVLKVCVCMGVFSLLERGPRNICRRKRGNKSAKQTVKSLLTFIGYLIPIFDSFVKVWFGLTV